MLGTCRTLIRSAILVSLATIMAPAAFAQSAFKVEVPSQDLADALRIVGRQTNTNIIFEPAIVKGIRVAQLRAELTPDEAINKLLGGTKLTAQRTSNDTIVVQREKKPKPENDDAEHPTSQVRGDQKPSFWDRFRLAQADTGKDVADRSTVAPSSDASSTASKVEEIVVTAQKRQERLIDAPQSVSVLSSDTLTKLAAQQFRDYANTVPGLVFTTLGAGESQISLRGVTVGVDISPTVGIYVDDVPYGSSSAFASAVAFAPDVGLFDMDRTEVLRGPQGTLYGASTMGGLLKYVTKRADPTRFFVDAQTGVAATRDGGTSYNAGAAVNIPLIEDNAALRVSGFYTHDGGYINNVTLGRSDVNRSNIYGGRADLLFTPNEALTIRLTGFLQDISRDGEGTADFSNTGAPLRSDLDQFRNLAEPFGQRFRLGAATVTYNFGPSTLTSISSYQTAHTQTLFDFSGLYVPLLQLFGLQYSAVGLASITETDKFTQEVRLASNERQALEWLFGGFYTHESSQAPAEFVLRDPSGAPAPNILLTYSAPSKYDEYATFGDLTWHLTDKFNVTGGARYARNDQQFEQIGSGILGSSKPETTASENVLTYLANARYFFTPQATGYARFATGYRPGGPNAVTIDVTTGLPNGNPTFKADRLKSYEIGFKAESSSRRWLVDAAAYLINWDDIQINVVRGGFGFIDNAPGGARVKGAELSVSAQPFSGFTTSAAFGYQDARVLQANADLGAAKGERLPNVPRFTASLNADYQLPLGTLRPTIGATLRHVTDRMTSFGTSPTNYHLPEYTTVDLRGGLSWDRVNIQFYLHNVGDERGQLSAATIRGRPQPAMIQPRTVGLSVMMEF